MTTAVIVPDVTRPIDYEAMVEPVLANRRDDAVTVLVALGLHRPMTDAELAPLARLCDTYRAELRQHDAHAIAGPLSPLVEQSDEIVCVGVVEPHQYAGFSGGVKGIAIGCASAAAIAQMHSLSMLGACGAKVGWFDGNPFQAELWRRVEHLPDVRGRFVVPGHDEVFDGPVREAFERAVEASCARHFRTYLEPVDSVVIEVPPVKASNFYQASRAATYVALSERPIVRPGGSITIVAACPEGIGAGAGERACAAAMRRGVASLLDDLRAHEPPPTLGGEQRAYVLAMVLERYDVALVGAPPMEELAAMGIRQPDQPDPSAVRLGDVFSAVPVLRR